MTSLVSLLEKSDTELKDYFDSNPAILKLITANSVFRKAYRDDYCAFVHDCIEFKEGEQPTDYQDEILSELPIRRKVAVRSPHGAGKTALASWVILGFVLTRDGEDFKCPTTASAWRQLTKYLWPEIHKWSRRIIWQKIGRESLTIDKELLKENIKLATGEAFAVASDKSDLIEGAHADELLYVLDEAKAIPDNTWNAVEGAFSAGNCYAFAISTPGEAAGRFYDIHSRKPGLESWWIRKITKEEAIAAGRVSKEWADDKRRLWGSTNPIYVARVEADFPKQSEDQLISLSWIEAARERSLEEDSPQIAGQDVARYGSDDSVWMLRYGPVVKEVRIVHGQDTHEIASYVKVRGYSANVDVIGIGSGVCDNLKHWECAHNEINVAEKAEDSEHFANLRAELFWNLRNLFEDGEIDLSQLLQEDYDRLVGELVCIKVEYRSGKIHIKPKEDIRKELRKRNVDANSPDMADALMLAFADLSEAPPMGQTITTQHLGIQRGRFKI